ncbi:hypothetical protein ACVBEH_17855 [Roseateles sp. GG27B]
MRAIELAARAGPLEAMAVQAELGFAAGDLVQVAATDYAADLVSGELLGLTPERITLRRSDERAGVVHVHFPRIGYSLRKSEGQ